MRMSGRAAEEIMGLEISIERFYDDLKLAIPHIQNIAIIEGKYFPNIKQDNPKDLDQIYYNKYIMVAKVSINNIANANNFTSDKLIKKITTNIIMLANNRYN